DFEPPEVPFQPKPTSVSILAIAEASTDFSGDSEASLTTEPKSESADIHGANTMILDAGRGGRGVPRPPPPPPPARARAPSQPPPSPRPRPTPRPPVPPTRTEFDEDLHSAPTMIIDTGRARGRGRA
ncbi:MAG TPA: hypothetical protein VK607_24345, partial [Kofleriaceae bacterium]|nr:hypothetical protein [Kofleriaceae bacterium]